MILRANNSTPDFETSDEYKLEYQKYPFAAKETIESSDTIKKNIEF
jgi:hypothetical protein